MDLATKASVEWLCKKYKFWPQRTSGQNFLISRKVLSDIITAAQLQSNDTVLEIGAGFGTLTVELLKVAEKVIAVEMDKRLAVPLKKLAAVNKNLALIRGDIFKEWPAASSLLKDLQYKLVANLPYNITSLVLRNFLENKPRPRAMVLMVQKEVAERVVAKPGRMSLLAVAVQFFGQPEIIRIVSSENFWPSPDVDSAILRINGIGLDVNGYQKLLVDTSGEIFFKVVRVGFSAKRKQLHNNLAVGLGMDSIDIQRLLEKISINPRSRAQDLAINDWIKITQNISG